MLSKVVVGRIWPSKDIQNLTLETYEYVTLLEIGDFAGTIKLRILRLEEHPELSLRVQCNHKGPYKKEEG